MKCLDCQSSLVKISTTQGPDLDVCSSGHGLWLDAGEVNFFVEDYLSLKRAVSASGGVAVRTQTNCPRCGIHMEFETASGASFLSCGTCHGWWLTHGTLSSLNESYRGGAVPITINEAELYRLAVVKASPLKQRCEDRARHDKTGPQNIWFWVLFLGLALLIGGLILAAGIMKTIHTARWSQPPDQTLLYFALGVLGGVGLFVYGWRVHRQKRLIESIPTSTIRSLALGLVEITGRAQPTEGLLSSPFSGLPCVFYSYVVEEEISSGKTKRWSTVANGTSEHPFFVNDGTGRVLILPHGAELIFPKERTYRQNWLGVLPPATVAGLNQLGISSESWIGSRPLRCRETCILPEEQVYILGTACEQEGAKNLIENSSRLYIGGSRDNQFIISDRSETELVSRLRWQMWGAFLGGLILTIACLTIISRYYLGTVV